MGFNKLLVDIDFIKNHTSVEMEIAFKRTDSFHFKDEKCKDFVMEWWFKKNKKIARKNLRCS